MLGTLVIEPLPEKLYSGGCSRKSPVSNTHTISVCSYTDLVDNLYLIFRRYNTEETTVWTKGPMDLFCIKDICEYLNMETPWKFWQPRDIRTAKEIIKKWKVIENGNAHDALEDALTELSELKLNLI